MEEFCYYNDLFSIYKSLLTEKECEIFSSYYEDNLSMGEIAENRSISRAAVGNTVKIVEKKLEEYEQKLKIYEKNQKILNLYENCDAIDLNYLKEELLILFN